jgi:hypothetical protein
MPLKLQKMVSGLCRCLSNKMWALYLNYRSALGSTLSMNKKRPNIFRFLNLSVSVNNLYARRYLVPH